MRTNKNKKHKILPNTEKLLFCLLVLLLLASWPPSALSPQIWRGVVGSSGTITYPSATLHVADSTPEGPVPYTIDGQSGYDTGMNSIYTISAGVHTIELPSPYTSPISDITYYFSYWQDGPTDNPRNVTLETNETYELFVTYSTSPEPPPPPPPPPPSPSGDFLAYTGIESNVPPPYDAGPMTYGYWVGDGLGGNYKEGSSTRSWDVDVNGSASGHSVKVYNAERRDDGARMALTMASASGGLWNKDLYQSKWIYIDYQDYSWGYWQFFELREFDSPYGKWGYGGSSLSIFIMGSSPSDYYWMMVKGHVGGNPQDRHSFKTYITSTGYSWGVYPTGVNPDFNEAADLIVNPHGVPYQRWFKLEFYLHRSSNHDGTLTVWITDPYNPDPSRRDTRTLFHIQNVDTSDTADYPSLLDAEPVVIKQYCWAGVVYYDEIYIYNYNAHQ